VNITGENTTNTDPADDTINVRSLPASVTANLFGGTGNDTFNIGSDANPALSTLDPILGVVNANGDTHLAAPTTTLTCGLSSNTLAVGDTLNVNDAGHAVGDTYSISPTSVQRQGPPVHQINYLTIETLNVNAGTVGDAAVSQWSMLAAVTTQ
jgi:hypothetical protein